MSHPPRVSTFALSALLLLSGTPSWAKIDRPPCGDGRFLIQGAPIVVGEPVVTIGAVTIEGARVHLSSGCPSAAAKLEGRARGTALKAKWPACTGLEGKIRLKASIDPTCSVMTGLLRGRKAKLKTSFSAKLSRCGDGVFDPAGDEACEGSVGCGPTARCTTACVCEPSTFPPVSTTVSSTTVTTTSTTSTSSTTTPPGPEACDVCEGSCLPKEVCHYLSGPNVPGDPECRCVPGTPCRDGVCAEGFRCEWFSLDGVDTYRECIPDPPVGPSCGGASAPQCDGACPGNLFCTTFGANPCACLEFPISGVACGEFEGAPACAGECPAETPICADVDGTCTCTP